MAKRKSQQSTPIVKCSPEEFKATLLAVYRNMGMSDEAANKRADEAVARTYAEMGR
jgi:hypothetical protein